MARQSTATILKRLLEQFTPSIRNAFMASIADIKSAVILQRVIDAIERGDIELAFQALGFNQAAMRPLTAQIENAFEMGGVTIAGNMPRLGANRTVFRFDVRNSRAEAWLRDHSSKLVVQVADDQRTAIRNMLDIGMVDGRNPRNVALDMVGRIDPTTGRRAGGIVGLTSQQAGFVSNARRELSSPETASAYFSREMRDKRFDSVVRKSIAEGRPLDSETIAKLTGRYSDNLLRLRGETIARTEALQSLNKSSDEAFRQAVDAGLIKPDAVKRVWDSAGDGRVRDSHAAMDGQSVGLDEAFTTPGGARMMHPGDWSMGAGPEEIINCRCVVRTEVDFLKGLDNPTPTVVPVPPAPPPAPTIPPIPLRPIVPTKIDIPKPIVAPTTFEYESFKPLPSIPAVEAFMREKLANNVSLSQGVKLDGLNTIAHAMLEVNERFGMSKAAFVGDPTKTGLKIRWSNPTAAYLPSHDMVLFKNAATDDAKIRSDSQYGTSAAFSKKNYDIASGVINASRFVSPEVKQLYALRNDRLDWGVSNNAKDVMYHEMGHRLERQYKKEFDDMFYSIGGNVMHEGWHYLIGRYAATNRAELVAESFSLYMQGNEAEFYRIHPKMLALFRKLDKKGSLK